MGKDEVSVKKRRKTDNSKTLPADVYKHVVEFEESEAQLRPAEKDAALFRKVCQDIRQLFEDIAELKTINNDEAKEKISAKRIEASLLLVALKKLNRLEKVRTRAGRDALHKEKQRVDSTHLLLQNLLYEADHLNKEVTKCLQFKSKDEEIDLVPLEDFYKEAPVELARPEITNNDEHQLQLARLEWELRQRRELAGVCNDLVNTKQRVAAAIAASKSRLDALAPHLRDILKSTKPLQELFNLKLDEKRDRLTLSKLLPKPLFLLYANVAAYSDVLGSQIVTVEISGDEDEARRIEQLKHVDNELMMSNDSDSDQDKEEVEEEVREKKKRHHKSTKVSKEEKAEAKKKEVLKKHPLNILVSVKGEEGTTLNLVFSYLIYIKIVVVKFTISVDRPITGVSAADVLNGQCILNELYIGDTGIDSPHPATAYLLKAAGVMDGFQKFIPEVGRPYVWAQRICGLDFMAMAVDENKVTTIQPCQDLSLATVENFIFTLRKRLKARVELMRELQELESGKIYPSVEQSQQPLKLSGSLTQWQTLSWAEYSQALSTSFILSEGLVSANDMLYRAIITRQSAKLVALVALKGDYPKIAPIFSLTLHWNGTHHAGNSDSIRDIERVINTELSSKSDKRILSSQMTKLLMCLDIYLETSGSAEFPPDKVILRDVKGRNRARPYKCLKQSTGVIFVQY